MTITPEEYATYREFTQNMMKRLGSVEFDGETVLWHYTTGPGLLGIVESGQIFATQVACLNDSSETTYATDLFKSAIKRAGDNLAADSPGQTLVKHVFRELREEAGQTSSSPSKFFVSCFTTQEDDLSQWRAYSEVGGENGYAIGFKARGLFVGPNSLVVKVNYDKALHEELAEEVAAATLRYYQAGLELQPDRDPEQWAKEFFQAWDDQIYRLTPLIKDEGFQSENEFRIVHELQITEIHLVRFRQKKTLLSRHIPLTFPVWMGIRVPILPIVEVIVGPSRQREVSRVSVNTLLMQMGYRDFRVGVSKRPLQLP
jgi:hypothetical protein